MERFGLAGEEGSASDPSLVRTAPQSETGLEASMWRLGLGVEGSESFPERPDEPDCIYYLRTGACGYGSRCRFNHPPNRTSPVLGGLRTAAVEFPERMGEPVCQHFMRTGTCKFGASCKYHHPRGGGGGGGGGGDSVTPISLNHMGYPLRPGEKECSYYLRTGHCKFGSTCRFHHPIPPGLQAPTQQQQQLSRGPAIYSSQSAPSSQQNRVAIPRPQFLPGSYVQSPYGYTQMVLPPRMLPYSAWNHYQASVNVIPSPGSPLSVPLSPSAPAYISGPSPAGFSNKEFPQRPGQPECQYFMRTGDCKFGSSCIYHHPPKAALPKDAAQSMGSSSLSYSTSASSLTDMPVAPYPLVSSSLATLAPSSSSSSDQRLELLSSSSIKPKTTTNDGSETLAAEVSSSVTSGVSHTETAETNKGDSASIEAKTSN